MYIVTTESSINQQKHKHNKQTKKKD